MRKMSLEPNNSAVNDSLAKDSF